MLPKYHALYGAVFSLFVHIFAFPGYGVFAAIVVFLSTVFIDVDHYLFYVYKKADLSLVRAYYYFLKGGDHRLMIFHTIEFVLLLYLLSFYSKYFLFVIAGFLFHWGLDIYDMNKRGILKERTYSLIHHLMTRDSA